MMRSRHLLVVCTLLVLLAAVFACLSTQQRQQQDYGLLMSAVAFSADKVYGEYADAVPDDFDGKRFLLLLQGKIPDDYYAALQQYRIEIVSRTTYYLLTAFDDDRMILFDFSCTKAVDGPVFLQPGRHDLADILQYDPCK